MALPFGDPRKRWWTLMGGGQGAPLSPKFTQGALSQWFENQQGIGPNYGNVNDQSDTITAATNNAAINAAMARQASQTPTAPFGGGIGKSAYQGVGSKKKGNKLKYIVEALQELEGPEPPKLAAGKYGRAMPRALGFSLPGMGGRLEEQEAMAKARREEELRRRMKLMGGGY